jgi:hypothetical protein
MILQISAEAPLVARAGAAALLWLHIGGASLGLVAGPIALVAKKGAALHRWSGTAFFGAMLAMSGVGAAVAPFLPDRGTTLAGLFVFYLTATAWAAARRAPGTVGTVEIGGFLAAVATACLAFTFGWIGAHSPDGRIDRIPYEMPVVVGLVIALCAAVDLKVILKGGLFGPDRLARHLWRMCLALAMAYGSLAGQPKALPPALRGQPLTMVPALVVLGLMVFWLVKVRPRRRRAKVAAVVPATVAVPAAAPRLRAA